MNTARVTLIEKINFVGRFRNEAKAAFEQDDRRALKILGKNARTFFGYSRRTSDCEIGRRFRYAWECLQKTVKGGDYIDA